MGDPQKLGSCGGTSANSGMPTNAVNKVRGGQTLHITLQETIFHPGHYRGALAVNSRSELPPEADVTTLDTDKAPWSSRRASRASITKIPVVADGLFVHTARQNGSFETDVQLPNIHCEKCTLQIEEFMAKHGYNHAGGYLYHHCAVLQMTPDAGRAIDTRWRRLNEPRAWRLRENSIIPLPPVAARNPHSAFTATYGAASIGSAEQSRLPRRHAWERSSAPPTGTRLPRTYGATRKPTRPGRCIRPADVARLRRKLQGAVRRPRSR